MMSRTLLILLLLFGCNSVFSEDVTRVLWDKKPIAVDLAVNKERIIHFPTEVRYWVPTALENSLSILAANGVLYIKAYKAFDETRIRVQALDTQKIYLLDLTSIEGAKVSTEIIVTDENYTENKSSSSAISRKQKKGDWYIRLARFAAQSHYAPERLMPSDHEIRAIPINTNETVSLIKGGNVETTPIYSWKGADFYVTSVLVKNTTTDKINIVINPNKVRRLFESSIALKTDIRGDWLAVVPQHTFMTPMGTKRDRTTFYLISKRSFMESL